MKRRRLLTKITITKNQQILKERKKKCGASVSVDEHLPKFFNKTANNMLSSQSL